MGRQRGRARQTRQTKTTVLVVTNGEKTERQYLNGLKNRAHEVPNRDFTVQVKCIPGEPVEVLRKLQSCHSDVEDYDEVWLVFDVDDKPHEGFLREFARAHRGKKKGLFRPVFSNPCFEVWLAAHYGPLKRYQNRGEAQRHFGELTGRSASAKELPQDFPWERLGEACTAASSPPCSEGSIGELGSAPSTAMPVLVQRLRLAGESGAD